MIIKIVTAIMLLFVGAFLMNISIHSADERVTGVLALLALVCFLWAVGTVISKKTEKVVPTQSIRSIKHEENRRRF
jgi:hypothetical protein